MLRLPNEGVCDRRTAATDRSLISRSGHVGNFDPQGIGQCDLVFPLIDQDVAEMRGHGKLPQ
jgi:hypothetical protein